MANPGTEGKRRIPDRQLRTNSPRRKIQDWSGSWSRKEPAARGGEAACPGQQHPLSPRLAAGGFCSIVREQNTLLPGALLAFDQILGLCQGSLDSVWVASKLTYPNPKDTGKRV